jgi:hypothetical protein
MFLWSLALGVRSFFPTQSFAAAESSPRQRHSFNSKWLFIKSDPGLAFAIVRSTGEPGVIVVKAESPGLASSEAKIASRSQ